MKITKKLLALVLVLTMTLGLGVTANAASDDKPILALGADLSTDQRAAVLGLLGVDESELANYDVISITNAEEHQYLDAYLSSSVIGTHALSSVLIRPAEEGAGSKQFMARAGLFDDVDFVYTWHPSTINGVESVQSNAIMGANFRFKGRTSHAAASPHLGRSALDAVELMSVGCNYLREHVIPEARIHYAYIDAGGTAPNVVQDHATVRYEVRTPFVKDLRELFDRVVDVAKGAALMTGTTLDVELAMAFTEYVPNKALGAIASEAMQEVGAPRWDEADFQLARQFLLSYDPETRAAIEAEIRRTYGDRAEAVLQRPLSTDVIPFDPSAIRLQAGSTDVGDVGYAAPTLNLLVATACVGNVGHSWQMTAQACSPLAHKGLLTAAGAMALSAVRTKHRPDAIAAAKAEVLARNGGKYTCPLPDSVKPPLDTY